MAVDRGRRRFGDRQRNIRRQLTVFYGVAAIVLLAVATGAFFASRSVARTQALQDAERMAERLAKVVVAPLLPGVLAGNAEKRAELDVAIQARMAEGYLSEVTIWALDGNVVYADEASEEGPHDPPAEVGKAILDGQATSGFEEKPEVIGPHFDPNNPGFVEVYVPFAVDGLPTYAFEAYYSYQRVSDTASLLLAQLLPVVLIPLVLLQLIQVPIAGSLARRVRRNERDRARLLERALSTSERERIRIAGDLHDGPIQDLAGISYALAAIEPSVPTQNRAVMSAVTGSVRVAIDSLRRLMVDLYPPDLGSEQLPEIIAGLARPLGDKGIDVRLALAATPDLNLEIVTTLYRVARESLANVVEHANATQVDISMTADPPDGTAAIPTVTLRIADNGVGMEQQSMDRRAEGHLGLRLLRDRVEALGGTLQVDSRPSAGTTVTARIPIEAELAHQ